MHFLEQFAHCFTSKKRINNKEVYYLQIRIISFSDNYEGYKLKGYADIDNISELIKTLNYMKENDIPITINTEDIVDTDGEDYYIKSFSVVFPKVGGEIIPHIVIYVEEV